METDMALVRYGQEIGILFGQIRGNLCSEKRKYSIELSRHFVLSDGFANAISAAKISRYIFCSTLAAFDVQYFTV